MVRRTMIVAWSLVAFAAGVAVHAQHPAMPPGMTHEEHLRQMQKEAAMKKRGNVAMGFDQDHTTHHFLLSATGGAIQVETNDPADQTSRDLIQTHLKEIASEFAKGVFDKPFATHAEVPPGVATMQRLKRVIAYKYVVAERGARVQIETSNAEALEAIHEFLRYQIAEHATGDPGTIQK